MFPDVSPIAEHGSLGRAVKPVRIALSRVDFGVYDVPRLLCPLVIYCILQYLRAQEWLLFVVSRELYGSSKAATHRISDMKMQVLLWKCTESNDVAVPSPEIAYQG